jgi:RNA polymerase-associated protein
VVETEPASPPVDLIDLNPYQTVPTLVDRELVVYEPGIVCDYIDERFPHPSLSSTDPGARAHARLALRRIEQEWYAVSDVLEPGSGADRRDKDRARRLLTESLLASEPLFRMRAWFLSDQFSQLDAAVAPILWRLSRWDVDIVAMVAAAPAIEKYATKVFARPSFLRSLSPAERDMRSGTPAAAPSFARRPA